MAKSPRCVYAEAAEVKLGTAASQGLDHLWRIAMRPTAFPHAHRWCARLPPETANDHRNAATAQATYTAAPGG
jgi:hypothetical protein